MARSLKPARLFSPKSPNSGSRFIESNQNGIHPDLEQIVQRHLASCYQKPISEQSYKILDQIDKRRQETGGRLILDSGCGTGFSSIKLAEQFPEDLIVGIDQSSFRLSKNIDKDKKENVIFFRANVIDIWLLMDKQGWDIDQHYLFYPNPWPKKKHLQRRWHGHPIFPALIKMSKRLEIRTNWKIYADEFSKAVEVVSGNIYPVKEFIPTIPMTPFEKKYQASGHTLYSCQVDS